MNFFCLQHFMSSKSTTIFHCLIKISNINDFSMTKYNMLVHQPFYQVYHHNCFPISLARCSFSHWDISCCGNPGCILCHCSLSTYKLSSLTMSIIVHNFELGDLLSLKLIWGSLTSPRGNSFCHNFSLWHKSFSICQRQIARDQPSLACLLVLTFLWTCVLNI